MSMVLLVPTWAKVFRTGIAPSLTDAELVALARGLELDDPALIQGQTLEPIVCPQNRDRPPCGACAVAYAIFRGSPVRLTGDEVEERFAAVVIACDLTLGHEAAARPFIEWWDSTAREEARPALLRQVR